MIIENNTFTGTMYVISNRVQCHVNVYMDIQSELECHLFRKQAENQ